MSHSTQIKLFLAGLLAVLALGGEAVAQSSQTRPQDACEGNSPKTQSISVIDREIATRAQERAESLRVRLFDLTVKELDLFARLDDLDYRSSPEGIQRTLAFVGSARPMDELREALRIRIEREKARVTSQLELLASNRDKLETALREAEAEAERLRQR